MRLIDADELMRSHCVECTYYNSGECLGENCDWDSNGHIREAKTVDAIPVEWIEKWLDEFLGVKLEEEITNLDPFKKNVYQGILLMYNDWRMG